MRSSELTLCAIVIMAPPILAAWASVAIAQTEPPNCDDWNTLEFFEVATADDAMACLAIGADVHARSDDGDTPLHRAAEVNTSPAVLEALVEAGADPNAGDSLSLTPLHRAAQYNENPEVIEALLANGAELERGASWPAAYAGANENPAVVEAFLRVGVGVNTLDPLNRLPLHMAAYYDNLETLQTLLRAGADPYLEAMWMGATALHVAASSDRGNTVRAMQALIDFGMEINIRTSDGRTPLHGVVSPENAEFLLANGADPRRRDASGNTALHRGLRWFRLDSEAVLELVALLVNAGGNVNARNENSRTPMHDVSPRGFNALLAHGADINAQDEEGNTRLHLEAGCSDVSDCYFASETLISLLDAGADATIRNAQGQTPWDLASANEDEEFSGSDGYWRLNEARFDPPSDVP